MDWFGSMMRSLNGYLWGPVMILFLVGTGIYLTLRLRFVQLRLFAQSVQCLVTKPADDAETKGDVSPFQALAAALSATIGTGNIAGVATAIALGGPGALFWMWVTAVVGMATKFTSCALAVHFRAFDEDGAVAGGPMYYLANGLKCRWLGALFALFAGVASFGIGCAVQSNSVADGLLSVLPAGIPGTLLLKKIIGLALAALVWAVIVGGVRRIATVAARLVPFMCAIYAGGALLVLARHIGDLPAAFGQILHYAFSPIAVGGGLAGVVLQRTIQKGVARGVFSNESGLGSAPIMHAAARTNDMVRQGLIAMLGPFVDTIIVCTMTGLVIIVTGAWEVRDAGGNVLYGPGGKHVAVLETVDGVEMRVVGLPGPKGAPVLDDQGNPYPIPTGAALTSAAFAEGLGEAGRWIVSIGLVLFAFSTMISWSYYGDRCWLYLLGKRALIPYRVFFCLFVFLGTIGGLDLVWLIADNLNALMAIPNLIALLALGGLVAKKAREYTCNQQKR